jgi:ABC-type transporter Mla maintaining outer membrane lipid asymmetry ATPase subunit MlaF
MAETTPVIEFVNVDVVGAELRADTVRIHDVTWRINPGEFWCVGGLPGTGKTDLLSTAAALQRPGKGEHYIFGQNLARLEEDEQLRERLRIGLVFQGSGRLFAQLNVMENLALPICYHQNISLEEAREQARAVLQFVELPNIERRRPSHLTRTVLQRVALARALMLAPEVLLIDNPLFGIDIRQAYWWRSFLPKLAAGHPLFKDRPITLVVTADELVNWRGLATHFALVHEKKWSIIGARADLQSSADPAVLDLLATEFNRQEK